ncbi:hypothetical protein QZH41_005217 [Actinostola sp. cb2023]|nr:hypothetical protein QZH41_005217 [Actinostola sp. cb2023]
MEVAILIWNDVTQANEFKDKKEKALLQIEELDKLEKTPQIKEKQKKEGKQSLEKLLEEINSNSRKETKRILLMIKLPNMDRPFQRPQLKALRPPPHLVQLGQTDEGHGSLQCPTNRSMSYDGSDTTMCLRSLAEDLGVEGKPVEFVLSTMIEESILTKNELSSWPHLKDVNMAEIPNKEITILIGSDAPEALCPLEVKSGLPWKYDAPQLPNNRSMAERRHELLKKRLLRDPVLAKKYTETMEQYIAKGHAAKVQEDSNWPPLPDDMPEIADGDVEVKKCVSQVPVQVNVMSSDAKTTSLSDILHRSSSWYRLCKLIAWLVRFKTYCRSRYGKGKRIEVSKDPLSVKEISEAEDDIVRLVQREAFCLKKDGSLKNLSPILEEGILRVGGRLVNAPVEETLKHPAILPSKHHVTNLIVSHYHKGNGHVGANQTLSAIRQKYWIIKGPSTVRRIMNTCLPCRRQNQLLDEETLLTTLCEVEKIINDRPLTPLSNDPKDMEVLTPSSLLLLRQNHSVPPCDVGDSIKLKERWKLAQQLADSFWKRWISEYLPTLQEKQKWLRRQRNMSVGDLVLIKDDNIQRGLTVNLMFSRPIRYESLQLSVNKNSTEMQEIIDMIPFAEIQSANKSQSFIFIPFQETDLGCGSLQDYAIGLHLYCPH